MDHRQFSYFFAIFTVLTSKVLCKVSGLEAWSCASGLLASGPSPERNSKPHNLKLRGLSVNLGFRVLGFRV